MVFSPSSRRAALVTALVLCAAAAFAPAAPAQAPPPPPPPGDFVIGLEIQSVDAAAKKVTGIQHCVPPEIAGQPATFAYTDAAAGGLTVGSTVGVILSPTNGTFVVKGVVESPCQFQPGQPDPGPQPGQFPGGDPGQFPGGLPGQFPGGQPGQFPGGPGGPGAGPDGPPELAKSFLGRVWKINGSVDGFKDGVLSMTVEKILNVPRKFASQDDELLDEDALVLVSKSVRVYDGKKLVPQRKEASSLDDAESVRVHGKVLPPSKWRKDEDDEPVTTVRAKRIYITG